MSREGDHEKNHPKERVRAALNFQETDIVPYDIIIEPEVEDRLNEHYGGRDWEKRVEKHFLYVSFPVMAEQEVLDEKNIKDVYGCVWDWSTRTLHLVSFPLQEPNLKGYDFDAVLKRTLNSLDDAHGKLVISHCCGNIFGLIPDLVEVGLDGLESLQPEAMNVYEIKRRFGKNLRLWGGLGTQQLLPFGTPQEVRAEIRRLISEMGKGSGYILAAAKPIMWEVPTENAIAVIEEFAQKR